METLQRWLNADTKHRFARVFAEPFQDAHLWDVELWREGSGKGKGEGSSFELSEAVTLAIKDWERLEP